MRKRSRDPARVERVRTTPCKNLERIELSSESLMHHEPGNSAKKVLAVTSGLNDCIGSMTAMMSAAAPPGAAQQYKESTTNELHGHPVNRGHPHVVSPWGSHRSAAACASCMDRHCSRRLVGGHCCNTA